MIMLFDLQQHLVRHLILLNLIFPRTVRVYLTIRYIHNYTPIAMQINGFHF